MRLTDHELLTVIHGMVLGAGFLLIYAGALEGLWSGGILIAGSVRIETFEGSRPRLRRNAAGLWVLNRPGLFS